MLNAPRMELPELPKHSLVVIQEMPSRDAPGFLRLRRFLLALRFEDGTQSEPFEYDMIDRERLDAVVIAPHYLGADGRRRVMLRSALRPPLFLRSPELTPMPENESLGGLWELPAGLVEPDERSPEGLRRCAARELEEEIGVVVDPDVLEPLGPSMFPAPAMISERHFFFHVEVDPTRIATPSEDGSALERGAKVAALPLDTALELCARGVIEDSKTELALRRLSEI